MSVEGDYFEVADAQLDELESAPTKRRETIEHMELKHICEVCGVEEVLTPEASFEAGWDYPPKMGAFGILSPRTCPNCPVNQTVWWAISADHLTPDMLNPQQLATIERIRREPNSISVPSHDDA
jgi:hypothetical protein